MYVTVGFCTVEVAGLPPWKDQFHPETTLYVSSKKFTTSPEQTDVLLEKNSALHNVTTPVAPVFVRLADVHRLFRPPTDDVNAFRMRVTWPCVNILEQ